MSIKKFLTGTLLAFTISINNLPAFALNANYKSDIAINSAQRTVSGTQEVSIYNTSKDSLNELYFLLGLNNSYDTRMRVTEVTDDTGTIIPSGYYTYQYLGKEIQDKTVYKVTLPEPLKTGGNITLNLKFDVSNLSKINGIMFLDDSINDNYTSSWYPRLINYNGESLEKREFVNSTYEINATLPADEVVVASGVELETQNIKTKSQKKIYYKINKSRAFSFALSKNFGIETSETKNGTVIKLYSKNNKASKWNKSIMEITEDIVNFYYEKFGFYPYKRLSIVPGSSYLKGGYANANMIVLHENLNFKTMPELDAHLKWTLSKLIAEQYFGFYVGESGKYPKWITKGATGYLAYTYLREKNTNLQIYNDYLKPYLDSAKANFNTQILQETQDLINSNFDWENTIQNSKSTQIFKMLETYLGRKYMQDSLKEVLTKYQNDIVSTDNFKAILESTTSKDLEKFFDQWIRENNRLDYAIYKIKQERKDDKYQIKLYLKRLGKAVMPVSIAITLKSGLKVFQTWDGKMNEAELVYEYNEQVKSVTLDPSKTLPDIDTDNNFMNAPEI